MREFLFRGKRKDNGKWVEGYLYEHEPPLQCIVPENYVPEQSKWYILKTGFADWNMIRPVEFVEVDPETVGQYSGKLDKNKKKIFEGDILNGFEYPFFNEGEHNYFAEVVWFDECPAFGIYTFKNPLSHVRGISTGNTDYMEEFDSDMWEVIGNIYDNPDLLEVEQ